MLRKTYPVGPGLPFAYARIELQYILPTSIIVFFFYIQCLMSFYEQTWGTRELTCDIPSEQPRLYCH